MHSTVRHSGTARHLWRAVPVLGLLALLLGMGARPAAAHAYVASTFPDDTAALDTAPDHIRVTFDETVRAPIAAIRVYDATSTRVDNDDAHVDPDDPRTVLGSVPGSLADGPYVVTWRAMSFDGHTIIGSFSFMLGEPGPGVVAAAAVAPDADLPAALGVVAWAARASTAMATVVSAGGGWFFLLALRRRPRSWEADRRDVRELVFGAARVATGATVVTLLVLPWEMAGTVGVASDPGRAALDALVSPVGAAAVVRLLALLPLALAVRTSSGELLVTLWAFALASLAIDGHAATEAPAWLLLAADMTHLAALAAWVGGLAALRRVLHRRRERLDHVGAAQVVARFSSLAGLSLGAVAVSGALLGLAMVRSPAAATSTGYGRALLVKLALVAVVVAMGAWNRWRLVPAVAGVGDAAGGLARLQRSLRAEAGVLLAVFAVTGVLVHLPTAAQQVEAREREQAAVLDDIPDLADETLLEDEPSGPPLVNLLALGIAGAIAGAHVLSRGRRTPDDHEADLVDHDLPQAQNLPQDQVLPSSLALRSAR